MARLKHTPGPWEIGALRKGKVDIDARAGGWWKLARVCTWVNDEAFAEGQANATLIAAAPEMLQLLRDAWDAYMCDPNPQALTATMNKVEELLARLDGE